MSNVYVGDCSYKEVAGWRLDVDPWGMDRLTRKIEGRVDQVAAYIATLARRRDIPDSIFPDLFLVNYGIDGGRAFAEATLTFSGILGGNAGAALPAPVILGGWRSASVTVPFITDAVGFATNGISATFEYHAPQTTFNYVVFGNPAGLRYPGFIYVTKETLRIANRTGAGGDYVIFKGNTITAGQGANAVGGIVTQANANAYNMVAQCVTKDFQFQQVGQWWQCTEVNAVELQPLDLQNAGAAYEL